jgi:hypothetical protein
MCIKAFKNIDKIRFRHGNPFTGSDYIKPKSIDITPSTYILFNPKTRLTKIGRSTNYNIRKRNLEIEHNAEMILIVVLKANIEQELHLKYNNYVVFGEWFYLSDRILNEIKALND